jgi:solute carrier family 8 (sodium/calcium exchanger)
VSLLFIGIVTAIVEQVATLFGCALGLSNMVTAITFVAMGTSLPDTFASKQATIESDDADAAVGNITGSNSVNVFLGCAATLNPKPLILNP